MCDLKLDPSRGRQDAIDDQLADASPVLDVVHVVKLAAAVARIATASDSPPGGRREGSDGAATGP
ncbi:hypothetical protein [Propionicimonas sp.]|uniref:hypothetical protein n=1 Tax=Propionicimonas sp. TaxID=1955623 RepID=UPI0039E64AE8